MAKLGAILGAIIGLALSVVFTEGPTSAEGP
jgi:hypothetical protein